MAFDGQVADRVRQALRESGVSPEEKRMMGGLCFMVDGKMCLGVVDDRLMVRVGPDAYDGALQRKGAGPMDFTGRPMRGFVFVDSDGLATDGDLASWIALALAYNPSAPVSKKRRPGKRRRPGR